MIDNKIIDNKIIDNKIIDNKIIDNSKSYDMKNEKMINDKMNDTINYEDIDFGVKIEELNINNIIKSNTQSIDIIEKKIIKIGKKKK
jgi:hypothetical protein